MKRNLQLLMIFSMACSLMAGAGTISGKVSGMSGSSVVYVNAVPGQTYPAPTKHALFDQKGLRFQPHAMVIQRGTTVDFLNSDTVAHNVFWPAISGNKKLGHNLGTWPQGEKRSFKFDNPGVVSLLCNVHPEMSGYLVVSPTPYFAETDESGAYKIENIPDGKYNVAAWHEGAKAQTQPVTVSGDSKLDFTVSK
jgi:plastocyanin